MIDRQKLEKDFVLHKKAVLESACNEGYGHRGWIYYKAKMSMKHWRELKKKKLHGFNKEKEIGGIAYFRVIKGFNYSKTRTYNSIFFLS